MPDRLTDHAGATEVQRSVLVFLSVDIHICPSIYLSIYLSVIVFLSGYIVVDLPACLSIYLSDFVLVCVYLAVFLCILLPALCMTVWFLVCVSDCPVCLCI